MRFEKELMGMLWKVNENEIKLRNKQAAPKQQAGPHPTKKLVRMVSNQWFILLDHSFLKSLFNLKKQKKYDKHNFFFRKPGARWDLVPHVVWTRTSYLLQLGITRYWC